MKKIEIKAPAKINIGLNIVSKRDDGYHNLETFFYPIHDLYDYIIFEKSGTFSFFCSKPELNNGANLIVKAVKFLEEMKKTRFHVNISCEKNIPMGAGLGGGSSDAAAVLICMNELFNLNFKYEELVEFSLLLGSDVPFFLKSKPAIGYSRGEILKLVPVEISKYILLVNPLIHVSTKEAFSNITPSPSNINYEEHFKEDNFNLSLALAGIRNDFEANVQAAHPEIKEIKDILKANGAGFAIMSGTGSTVYGFFDTLADAEKAKSLFPAGYFSFISMPDNYFH
jgi:4-diphosphocytidyl-2-C-methyl-D-erythritol kinase